MNNLHLNNLSIFSKLGIFALLAGLTFVSCDTASNNNGNRAPVTLQFQTTTKAPMALAAQTGDAVKEQAPDKLTIKGSNGTLTINDIRFIVDDFELEKADGACDDQTGEAQDKCEEFESNSFLVDLPLNGQPVDLSTAAVEDGAYTEMEFEIADLDLDENEDPAEQQQIQILLDQIQNQFPNWPKSASMVISGTFKSNTGEISEFQTFAEAEVSIETQLNPPLTIKEGTGSKTLTVNINPEKWFMRDDGSVLNLANYDYTITNQLLEFESEMESGILDTDIDTD